MNTDPHPAPAAEADNPPTLTLVLPPHLTSDDAITGLARVIEQLRRTQALRTRRFRQMAEECAASGGQEFRLGLLRGQASAAAEAAAAIDESVIEVFDLWPQYEAQTPPSPAHAHPDNTRPCGSGRDATISPDPAGPSGARPSLGYWPAPPASGEAQQERRAAGDHS
jgi:hypothetical protein